jgi:hypothetical protein
MKCKNGYIMQYNIVGYGSLISHKSLKETIYDRPFTPVIVKGYKRIFDLATGHGKNRDLLNVIKSPAHNFNGVLFSVNDAELVKLKEREDDYNLAKTVAYDFVTGKELGNCFITVDVLVGIDHSGVFAPEKGYFILCREAAYHISEEFGRYWDDTTYNAKGEKIADWLKLHPEYAKLSKS